MKGAITLIWIFNREDRLELICSNDLPEALPIFSAEMHEVLNGDINLNFEVALDHKSAKLIETGYSAAVKREDGTIELFIISEIEEIIEQQILSIHCRHAIQELNDEIIADYFADRKEASVVLPDLLLGTRWTAGFIKDTTLHDLTVKNGTVLKALTTFIERWEGEVFYNFEITSEGIIKREINFTDLLGWHGENPLRRFQWSRDLLEVTRTINEENVKTALIGIGKKETGTDGGSEEAPIDPTFNTNILTAGQKVPDTIQDMNGWTWAGEVTESISTDKPTGTGTTGINTSFVVTQTEASSDFMVANTAETKRRVDPNELYTASAYVKCSAARDLSIWIEFYPTGTGELLHKEYRVPVAANTWTRLDVSETAPDKSYTAMIEVRAYNVNINDKLYYTGGKLEQGNLTPFAKEDDPENPEATPATEDDTILFTDEIWTTPTNPVNKPAGQSYIEDPVAREKYGRLDKTTGIKRNRIGFYQNDNISDPTDLIIDTWDALQTVNKPSVSYKLKVLDLAKVEGLAYKMVIIGDQVAVLDEDLGALTARCIEIKRDLLEEENTELLLESFQPTLTGGGVKDPSIRLDELEIKLGEKIDRGETINTDWLESEMAILAERVLAGAGTVTITDTEGILIEEDPINKQGGAMRLLGGTLALADTFDFRLNTYNWRAFGTGEGFLADLVETGFLRFDRSKGGTLQLGGEIIGADTEGNLLYENGSLVVYGSEVQADGRPIVVNLNGDQGGFDRLSIGELTNIHGTNILTKTFPYFLPSNQRSTNDIVFYVDPIDGNDNNYGGSDAPKATVQACLDMLPEFIDKSVYIYCLPTLLNDSDIIIDGFTGSGWIYIELWDVGAKTRYIRDWANGSTANTSTHWVEVKGVRGIGDVTAGGNTYPERINFYNGRYNGKRYKC